MKSLLADGVEVNGKTDRGQTALMLASVFGNEEVVKILLNAGADATVKDDLGLTAREWSLRRGFTEIAERIAQVSPYEETMRSDVVSSIYKDLTPSPDVDEVNLSRSEVSLENPSAVEASKPAEAVENGKRELGGAAGAILRSRSATNSRGKEPIQEAAHNLDDELQPKPLKVSSIETINPVVDPTFSNQPIAPYEEVPVFELSEDVLKQEPAAAAHRPPTFAEDPARQWSVAAEPDPLTLPPELIEGPVDSYYDDTKNQLLSLPSDDDDDETETTLTSHSPKLSLDTQSLRQYVEPTKREIKVPSFNTLQPQSSMRPMLWLVIAAVLGGSAFLAYQVNSYFFAKNNSPAIASQPENRATIQSNASTQGSPQPSSAAQSQTEPTSVGDGPVTGGPLAGTELDLPKPDYPAKARSKNVVGAVTMLVRVNRQGRVISWRTLDGDQLLRAAALKAAKRATFNSDKLPGNGEVVGTIRYNFPP